jgi:hypothetical protein
MNLPVSLASVGRKGLKKAETGNKKQIGQSKVIFLTGLKQDFLSILVYVN